MQTSVERGDNSVVDVVGLGYTATDYLSIVPRLPEPDTKLEALCLSIQGGGPVATGLVTARRLGLSASYVGKVGDDDFGHFMLRELEREGVDVSRVVCEKGATSQFAFIMVDESSATRTIVWTRGSVNKLRKGEANLDLVDTCKCLLLDDLEVEAAIEAAKRARLANVPIVLDAGSLRDGMRELVGLCDFVILGHSERRQYFAEIDEIINKKVKAALESELKPILCVGESLKENESGITEKVITRQIQSALVGVNPHSQIVVAYEPIWAIGTGRAATGKQANATISLIRTTVAKIWNKETAQAMRILYGGSVTAGNVAEFITEPEIDGALVGGASLKASEFLSIVSQTATLKSIR